MSSNFNPFAALVEDKNNSRDIINTKSADDLTEKLENIFGFTLSAHRSQHNRLIYLSDIYKSFGTDELNINNLEHAIVDRIFLENPHEFVLDSQSDCNEEHCEKNVLFYLFNCYKKVMVMDKIQDVYKIALKELILRNVITALEDPDLHSNQDVYNQLYIILDDTSYSTEFLQDIVEMFTTTEKADVDSMNVTFRKILQFAHEEVAKASIITLSSNLYKKLQLFTTSKDLALIFIQYSDVLNKDIGVEYSNTLLGALFNISMLPKTAADSYDFFQNPLDVASNTGTEDILWTNTNKVVDFIYSLILNLLKICPEVKIKTLEWLSNCLKSNSDRGKLWNAQGLDLNPVNYLTVSDGFMINFCSVLLKLCQPFCSNIKDAKIYKVDPTYCAVQNEHCLERGVHLLDMSKETCIIPVLDESTEECSEPERLTAVTYNFVTECFFMSHRALDLGYRVAVDKLVRLNQDMGRIERAYNDATSQADGMTDVVESIKERMKTELSKYLSLKAQLSEPNLLKNLFDFIMASASWLVQVAIHVDFNDCETYAPLNENDAIFPITTRVPETLKCIPEFVVENIIGFLVFLRRFNPKLFEEEGFEKLQPILTFILLYMGSEKHMKNPHLRAHLAEGLESLLPYHKDEPLGLNTLGGFQRELLFKEYIHRKHIVDNLLDVFVGIEMTGQSVQFEQKFNYRRPMYVIIDYLWQSEEYREYFRHLAQEAEINMEAVSPPLFLRFVNLLMNDAVFLLDEALANMAKLKEMQRARDSGEWDVMQPHERSQNMGYFQQVGAMARFDNILGRDTIRTLEQLTSKITIVFTHSTMVDRVASMLNYFLYNLVGPKKQKFKVKDQNEYSFDPASTVLDICKIYINLKESDLFCLAVSKDGRSYSPQLFIYAEDVLVRIGGGIFVGDLQDVASRVSKKTAEHQENEETISEAPDRFLDPIMSTLMMDPVILPSSKQTVDRTTIARHLLSDQTDPFNRAPLSMDQVIPNNELAEEIHSWLKQRKSNVKI